MEEVIDKEPVNIKRKKIAHGLLVGGLILSIFVMVLNGLLFVGSILLLVVLLVGLLIVFALGAGLATALAAVIASMFGGTADPSSAVSFSFPNWFGIFGFVIPGTLVLTIGSLVALVLAIVALVLFNKAQNKKKGIASGVLAVISGLNCLLIPVELVGGILAFTLNDAQWATPLSKKKKKKENEQIVYQEIIDYTDKETNE